KMPKYAKWTNYEQWLTLNVEGMYRHVQMHRRPNWRRPRWYTLLDVVGGGFLRTGCGPGPLEPDPGNTGEGNTARVTVRPHPNGVAAVLFVWSCGPLEYAGLGPRRPRRGSKRAPPCEASLR